ncbi:LON peptidase substrate-binding domain-containing protein [Geminocystis sp.]|uniref:LON peptidase substrate-binding domain-containing protein n=1 Tax=Geminocystis sp. TaxID=2664100 RepID=UPI0035939F1F
MASSSIAVRELPLFPLPEVVLFPGRPLPLHIFEFRYRMMINTILEYDRRFGVLMIDPNNGEIANIGCCAEIIHFEKLPDDRMKVLTLGQQRFRVLEYTREKPYRVALVEWFEDYSTDTNLRGKAKEVTTLLHDVVKLSGKLTDQKIELPENLPTLPLELSYWVASNLYGVAIEQQALLEIQDTGERLQREADILETTRGNLAARTALKDAFKN